MVVPAGTPKAAPLQFSLAFAPQVVDEVEIVVPPGPRGEVGFQLGTSGSQIIPATPGQYEVTDNEVIHWPLDGQMDSGAWQLIAYNTGQFNHTIGVRFLTSILPSQVAPSGFQPLPTDQLSG